ncbi:carbohydrate ABC transporter permease [Paenibacillus lautus]|jgi:multiple sugar transport system permease protein|uniref:Carbohydrate ABC transporter permease n=1 Tax=Paenibacillus lautus TaxID=1401 RepID=A0A385TUP6_PAELA|nr:carbohydrate ABC transporter permease [Paenibacillus lautus]AYB46077.1 carbohydrate ABC transporter permease [Paenibacillus lautus]MBY0162724.1 carbohydrate ABC transporter permease [Cytobacillus firmus]MCI1777482.1 carbohydrate ABC transporter permease [Paenibacillus lautus]VTR53943.1 maltose transporter permease [Actinobacillus pleuropneumoniae]
MRRRLLGKSIGYALIGISSLIMIVPFLSALMNSLKTYREYTTVPPRWIPEVFQWSNYAQVFQLGNIGGYTLNSIFVAALSVIGALISCSMVGYAFARLRFPLKGALFVMVLGTMMIPAVVIIIPHFIIFNKLNMLDTLTPLWIIEWLAQPFGIFLMRQAFMNIPKEYEEAAKMEGCNPFQIYLRIFIPMARPTLATLAIFTFMGKWNEILTPVIYLTSNEKYTLPIGILSLSGQWTGNEQLMIAAALVSLVPILLVFLFAEKYFVQNHNMAGIK